MPGADDEDALGKGKRTHKKKMTMDGYEKARAAAAMGKSALDSLEFEDQGDVYDVYDDEEYEKLVEKRRAEEEFVVDDGKYKMWRLSAYSDFFEPANSDSSKPNTNSPNHIFPNSSTFYYIMPIHQMESDIMTTERRFWEFRRTRASASASRRTLAKKTTVRSVTRRAS